MNLVDKVKKEIDKHVKDYAVLISEAASEKEFFALCDSLGHILSEINQRYNNTEVHNYIDIQVNFLFGVDDSAYCS